MIWNRLPMALRSPELSLSSFKRQFKTHLSVPALDSAGCSCGCRVPSSGAVVTVQRVRRRLQMSRLDSTLGHLLPVCRRLVVFGNFYFFKKLTDFNAELLLDFKQNGT